MDVALSACFIAVDDHEKALQFYRDVLGLEVRADVKFEGMRWVTIGSPEQPGISIVLESLAADPNVSPADRQVMSELLAKGLLRAVVFATSDCDALFERVHSSGVDVVQEPMDQPFGVRDFALRDPAGNLLRFEQPRRRR
jgi:predicted enzyme related to lactoylglutathione lyase